MWVQWSEERRSQHYEALLCSIPQVLEYSKSKSAVQKPGNYGKNKRRARLPETELFIERADIEDVSENNITLPAANKKAAGYSKSVEQVCIQIKRVIDLLDWNLIRDFIIEVLNTSYCWYSYEFKGRSKAISTFSLSVKTENLELHYFLKNPSVRRCKQCWIAFNATNILLVKTVGTREITDKTGSKK